MSDIEFSALAALLIGGFGLFGFKFHRFETQMIDRSESSITQLETELKNLRLDLAKEFRAQRAEVAAHIAALNDAINAARGE